MIITFDEKAHAYLTDKGQQIPSVTQILGKVYGTGLENAPKHFVERAAEKGTAIHKEIENYIQTGEMGQSKEFQAWHKVFKNTVPVLAGVTEKMIFATTPYGQFAGTVDLLGNGFLYDWKTCKTATRAQISKWQKQLSFYAYALRQMGQVLNEPLNIVHLTDKCDIIKVDYLGNDFVEETMRLYSAGETPAEQKQELQTVSQKDLALLEDTLFQIESLEKVAESIRAKIKDEMERRGILDLTIGKVKMTYVAGTIRQTFDSKKFREDDPYLYAVYLKDTVVKPSVRISIK